MKKLVCFVILFQISASVFSQEKVPQIEKGDACKIKLTELFSKVQTIGQDEDYLYFLQYPIDFDMDGIVQKKIKNFFVTKHDKESLQQVGQREVEIEDNNRKRQVYGASQIGGELCFFTGFQNESHKKHYLFVQSINKETLEVENNVKKIGEIDYSGIRKYNNTFFEYDMSPDSSKLMIYYNVQDDDGLILRHGMYVYTSRFEKLWENKYLTLGKEGGVFNYRDFSVDNNGDVFIITRKFENQEEYDKSPYFQTKNSHPQENCFPDLPNYKSEVFEVCNQGKEVRKLDVELPNKFIRSIGIGVDKQGYVYCGGIYSDPGMISAKGVFIFKFDESLTKKLELGMREIPEKEIDIYFQDNSLNYFHDCMGNEKEWDPYDYLLSNIGFTKDGNAYFVAEQYIKAKLYGVDAIIYFPIYRDLLFVNSDNKCQINVLSRIEKRQYCMNPNFNIITSMIPHKSYLLMEYNNQFSFVFKDYYRNLKMSTKKVVESHGNLVSINKSGEQNRVVFQDADCEKCPNIMPETAIRISDNELVFYSLAINRKSYSLNKVIWK